MCFFSFFLSLHLFFFFLERIFDWRDRDMIGSRMCRVIDQSPSISLIIMIIMITSHMTTVRVNDDVRTTLSVITLMSWAFQEPPGRLSQITLLILLLRHYTLYSWVLLSESRGYLYILKYYIIVKLNDSWCVHFWEKKFDWPPLRLN